MDLFINKLNEETSIKSTDYTVFDVANTTNGSFDTKKISYASFTKQLSTDISSNIKTLIDTLQNNINITNSNLANKLDKKGLTFNANERMTGTLYVPTLCATEISHFSNNINVYNNFVQNVRDPVLDQDAVNKRTLSAEINNLNLKIPNSNNFLSKSGDTMTAGNLTLSAEPNAAKHATTKFYVDGEINSVKTLISNASNLVKNYVALSGGAGAVMTAGFITAPNENPPTDNKHLANKKYVDDEITRKTANVATTTALETTFLKKSGDSMTAGNLTLFNEPTSAKHATTKFYVDGEITKSITNINLENYLLKTTADTTYIKKSGDSMTAGNLTLSAEPISAKHATTKKYVDDAITSRTANLATTTTLETTFLKKSGDSMTAGNLTLSAEPISAKHATTKKYVDDAITNINLQNYLLKTTADTTYIKKSGDSMTAGNLTLFNEPTSAKHATTKFYVDGEITSKTSGLLTNTTADTTYVKKSGDTMAGSLVLKGFSEKTGTSTATGTVNLDLSLGNTFPITLGGNITGFTLSNVPSDSFSITIIITQAATGGPFTATFNFTGYTIKWSNAAAPIITTTASKTDIFCFTRVGTTIYAFNGGQNF